MTTTSSQPSSSKTFVAPNSKESEMMVLGCMLTDVNSLNMVANLLNSNDFYYLEHKIIFHVMQEAFRQDRSVDVHLVGEELKRQDKLNTVGGYSYLLALAEFSGTAAHVEEYAKLVKAKSVLRQIISTAKDIERKALEEPQDVSAALDEAQNAFFLISQKTSKHQYVLVSERLKGSSPSYPKPYLVELQEKQELFLKQQKDTSKPYQPITGIPTHFIDLDRLIHGFNPSNLMILAARPAMGKTALALNIAENVCFKNNLPVGIFSLEMTADQLIHRMICSKSEVESQKISMGNLSGIDFQRIVSAVNEMQTHTLLIDDQPGLKITDLKARARRMKESYDIQFLIIDYLQLLSGSTRTVESRQNEISEISRTLKTLARELDIPILCLSQLSRKVEDRANHRPMMSDLRESGSIEQDSDLVMFLLRREYYDPHDKPGTAELIIAKNRHGSIGSVPLVFEKELARFQNYSALEPLA
ncbi:replicative DNA helicase [Chlamydiifrater volucris]|uniref:replicative DNA helicase n=1 Tax=Chlamydiifrater volucris TaxID=2681470 RepID=UPI001BCF3FF6|nr:replicative DNA helicase [Chlamydiifrater volucris]